MIETEAVQHAAEHGAQTFNPGPFIMHHIMDSKLDFRVLGYDLHVTKHVVMLWIVSAVLLVVLRAAARRSAEPVPRGFRNVLEIFIVFIRDDVARRAIPGKGDDFLGYLLTTFFFILTCNLIGLVPGMATATGNISVTAALAGMAFVMIQFGGIREYGLVGHLRNLLPHGLPVWLMPLILVIEVLSMLIRPFALCIRLFANMMAGHVVILAFISLIFILGIYASPVAVLFTLFVHFLELLVAFLQAYIFTMLTAQFIGLSVHPAH